MSTIPVDTIVSVTPSVLAAGGTALALNGLLLTTSSRVPIGTVASFPTAAAVGAYFGLSSDEAAKATIYFNGYTNSTAKPGAILFAQYPVANVAAYLRGGSLAAMTLTELHAVTGTLSVLIDGVPKTGAPDLSGATSFSNAAEIIGNTLGIEGTQVAAITASIAGTLMTVSAVGSGAISVGDVVVGAGVTAGTYVVSFASGSGGTGTYNVSASQSVGSESMTIFGPGVTFDSVSSAFIIYSGTAGGSSTIGFGTGAMAPLLFLTLATGAVTSQGAAAATPSPFMTGLVAVNRDWASFTTLFNPDNSGNANKLLFAAWNNGQNDRYVYVGWDTDASPTVTVPATTSFGYLVTTTDDYSGTIPIYAPDATLAVFGCGIGASIDFDQRDGRATYAFRSQTGLTPSVSDATTAANLIANGYNYYGAYATAAEQFEFMYPGSISGPFDWADSYVNQIWLNSQFQLDLILLLTQTGSIPYNTAGYAQIEQSLADTITQGLDFGAFRSGVTLSASQVAAVNASAGLKIAPTLQTRGWYLQVRDASPTVRQARGSPPCTFWYTDGESIQKVNLSSVALQ